MKPLSIVCLFFAAMFICPSASADRGEERVKALELKVAAMEETRLVNNQAVASTLARVQAMQEEFAGIRGGIEANRHFIGTRYDDLAKQLTGMDNRIQAIEDRLMLFSGQLSKALQKIAPEVAGETDMYQKALDLVATANYLEAASIFSKFIGKYPKSEFVPKAMFWIADCYHSSGDHRRAIKEFQTYIDKHKRSNKVPEAILKQGNSFYALGMEEEARAFYDKVLQSYPSSSAASQARERISRIEKRKAEAAAMPEGTAPGSYPAQTLEQRMKTRSESPQDLAPEKGPRNPSRTRPGEF